MPRRRLSVPLDHAEAIDPGNVIPFVRPRGDDAAPPLAEIGAAERPAPDFLAASERPPWWAIVVAASLAAHAGVAVLFLKSPDPIPAIGLETISVEVVFGANAPAGAAATPSDEAQPQPPSPPEAPFVKQEPLEAAPADEVAPPIPLSDPEDLARQKIKKVEQKQEDVPPPSPAAGGVGRGQSRNDANYNGRVAAHLARYKRFPQGAQNKRNHGTALVSFSLDGRGRVIAVKLVRNSGVAALDEEAQSWVRRASPFPAPPSGGTVEFTVPLSFRTN
jgi:TonB family protein